MILWWGLRYNGASGVDMAGASLKAFSRCLETLLRWFIQWADRIIILLPAKLEGVENVGERLSATFEVLDVTSWRVVGHSEHARRVVGGKIQWSSWWRFLNVNNVRRVCPWTEPASLSSACIYTMSGKRGVPSKLGSSKSGRAGKN